MTGNSRIEWDPDLVDVDDGSGVFVVLTITTILIILSTGARIATKVGYRLRPGIEDYMIIIALSFNLAANILEYQNLDAGFGRHLQFLSNDQANEVKRLSQITILMADISLWAVKISICFFLLSLIQNTHRRAQWVIYGLAAITTACNTAQGIFWGLQARPIEKLWKPEIPGTVADTRFLVVSIITFTAIDSVTDLFYALSPLYFFGSLQMDLRKKLVVCGLTGSGLLVFTSSIIRVAYVKDFFDHDYSWGLQRVYICTIVERNFAEVIADLPIIFPLIRSLHTKVGSVMSRLGSLTTRSSTKKGESLGSDGGRTLPPIVPATIGSGEPRADRFGDFGTRGVGFQRSSIPAQFSEDEIPLRERQHSQSDVTKRLVGSNESRHGNFYP